MGGRRKLLVVANRGPVSYGRSATGERVVLRGGGGLVTALRSLVAHHDVTWIASAMSEEDRAVAGEHDGDGFDETARDGSVYRLRLVTHDPNAYDWYYNVVANPTLWFLQHYMWGLPYAPDLDLGLHHAWFNGYLPVNEAFAGAVVAELERQPDAAVFLHDYHLYLAPKLIRERRPDAVMTHFIHIPWPQSDYWTVLPEHLRRAVHEGLLANDIVGFHTERWKRNFLRTCVDVLGAEVDDAAGTVVHDGRRTVVTSHPIGIDPVEFDELKDAPAVLEEERQIAAGAPGVSRPARRPHRSVQERRPRLPRLRPVSRHAPGSPRPRRAPRAAGPVPAGHPGVLGVPRRRCSGRRARSTTAFRRTAGRRSTCGSPTTSRRRWPRTSSTTSCSSTPSSTA